MLVRADKTAVVLFDMQLELIPLLLEGTQLLHNTCWVAEVAREFDLPLLLTEHKKLGGLSLSLHEAAEDAPRLPKEHFDFLREEPIARHVADTGREQYVLAGAETHVVVLQSALSLLEQGKTVFVLADTVSARNQADHELGLARLRQLGVHLITREMFFFELIRNSEDGRYLELAKKYLDGRYIR
ncbi:MULTISPECIES: hydrolase [Streptomyces]|uniref:LkcH n=3 Tax=Streptomyces TaxID=1883 RepID=G4V2H0_STRRO|nr:MULTISPECIES: hydrolase [Streptomyces]ADN64226.1 LkcH [Streptomyces rochei subsp. volubilis]MBA9050706.1 nicotinamidase-related amidase [Streptomyces murinus]QNT98116.1 putative hydrolase YcaC [Streptomyces griseofuscus]BAC76469.1 probable isochorismatase [Streptomyces rochei]